MRNIFRFILFYWITYDSFCSVYHYTVTLRIDNVMEIVMEVQEPIYFYVPLINLNKIGFFVSW